MTFKRFKPAEDAPRRNTWSYKDYEKDAVERGMLEKEDTKTIYITK